ncbi:hypothetical protein Q5530_19330 [Saccharothrix sp. BKS2]
MTHILNLQVAGADDEDRHDGLGPEEESVASLPSLVVCQVSVVSLVNCPW